MATVKNDLALHNLTLEDAIELALDKPRQQAELRTDGACRIMMIMSVFTVPVIYLHYIMFLTRGEEYK